MQLRLLSTCYEIFLWSLFGSSELCSTETSLPVNIITDLFTAIMVNNKTTVTGNSSDAATEFSGLFYKDQNAEGPAVSIKQAGPSPTLLSHNLFIFFCSSSWMRESIQELIFMFLLFCQPSKSCIPTLVAFSNYCWIKMYWVKL